MTQNSFVLVAEIMGYDVFIILFSVIFMDHGMKQWYKSDADKWQPLWEIGNLNGRIVQIILYLFI